MQESRLDRGSVELPFGQDLRDRDGMRDVRLAALAELAEVGGVGEAERFLDLLDVCGGQVALEPISQLAEADDLGGARSSLGLFGTPDLAEDVGSTPCQTGRRIARRQLGSRRRLRWGRGIRGTHAEPGFDSNLTAGFRGGNAPEWLRGDLAQHLDTDLARGNFTQGRDRRLVFGFDLWACGPGQAGARDRRRPGSAGSGSGYASGNLRR